MLNLLRIRAVRWFLLLAVLTLWISEREFHTVSNFYFRRVYAFKSTYARLRYAFQSSLGERENFDFTEPSRWYRFDTGNFMRFDDILTWSAYENDLDPNLVRAVVIIESRFNPEAYSKRGAQGLMQLMPGTQKEVGVIDPFDPFQNIQGGCRYLRRLVDMFGNDLNLALAAYNAGPRVVRRQRGVPPFPETKAYVHKVLFLYELFKRQNIVPSKRPVSSL